MTDREALIAIMARATVEWRWGRADLGGALVRHDAEMLRAALDAAEREGWRFVVPPDD